MPLTDLESLQLEYAYKDAAEKAAALPARLRAEFELAHAESREPFPVTPHTEVRAVLVTRCIDAISDAKGELADIIAAQRCCKKLGDIKVTLLSTDLKAIIDASGLLPKAAPAKAVAGA